MEQENDKLDSVFFNVPAPKPFRTMAGANKRDLNKGCSNSTQKIKARVLKALTPCLNAYSNLKRKPDTLFKTPPFSSFANFNGFSKNTLFLGGTSKGMSFAAIRFCKRFGEF